MNVWGIVIIALGVILIVMGIKGSQHNVLSVLQSVHLRSGAPSPQNSGNQGSTGTSQAGGTKTAGGRG